MGFYFSATASRPALKPTQWVTGCLTPGVKWLGHEADYLPPSNAEVYSMWSYTCIPPYVLIAWCLIKQELHLRGVALI
jgi:hypothetical protein